MQTDVLDNHVLKISAYKEAEVNEFGNLCRKGRYGYRYMNDKSRLKQPHIRKNGQLEPVSWNEAFEYAARRVRQLKETSAEWAVFGSPHSTNEENYLLQKFSRTVLGSNNIGSFSNLNELPEALLRASMSNTNFNRIEESDFIMVCNFDPIETHPVLYIKLQKAARRGQTVYMGCCPDSRLARKSKVLNLPDDKKSLFLQYLIDRINHSGWYEKIAAVNHHPRFEEIFHKVSGISQKISLSEFNLTRKEFDAFFKQIVRAKKP
ncbi:MAG: molybdopterin-dependent oxidoreductase, partial [Calditrichia bacterium]